MIKCGKMINMTKRKILLLTKKPFITASMLILMSATSAHSFRITDKKYQHHNSHIVQIKSDNITAEEAENFISEVTRAGISFLEDKSLSEKEKKEKFRTFLKQNFDLVTIGRFALGKYWRSSSTDQKKEYLNLFEDMVVNVYSKRFGEYDNQNITVTKAKPQGKKDFVVNSKIIQNAGPEIDLDWRVRKKKSGEIKIIDISVEGISMSLTQRSDFSSVIQRGGGKIDVLLNHLKK